ncbi:hypothetical protein ABIB40_001490 [Pedobacter sp. UYP30]|uniref:hypothetical protein n=1 Tax=Pedobacter sp. UYP30 TaxID=1756400 RepID=UPI00339A2580
MAIHIGKQIRIQADLRKVGATELGKLLNKSRETIYDIFDRESVDTELLLACCKVLNHDFFGYYYSQEPLLAFKVDEDNRTMERIEVLKGQLDREVKLNFVQEELIANQRENIKYLEQLVKKNK